ncbi:MAG: CaiB/BaiF CoA transferase family protein [Actinomycetota bacterium]
MTSQALLSGVAVIDLSTVGPASRCTAALRDLGATVKKVLAPEGKQIEPPFFAYGAGRGTTQARIDLKSEDGRAEFLALIAGADVLVESYRPGVATRLGIGYEAVHGVNPRLVYASLSGYGQQGPYAQWAGHDINYLALGGFLGTQGRRADGGPAIPGATIADGAGGGLHAALSICAALFHRERTGEGRYLDVSTTDGVLHLMALFVDEYLATGSETRPGSSLLTGKYACYDVYECADGGWISVGAIEPQFFANLCRELGHDELAAHQMDEAKQEDIRSAFRGAFETRTRNEWMEELAGKDTCVAPVLSISEVTIDEHLNGRGSFIDVEHPGHGTFRSVGPVLAGGQRG